MDVREEPSSEIKFKCCSVKTMCGKSLWRGVVYISVATLIVATISLLLAVLNVALILCSESQLNARPWVAFDLLFGLVVVSISTYQLVISSLLLWQALMTKGKIFICSVWYISHLSILMVYGVMFCARIAVSFMQKRCFTAGITIIICAIYEGTFIYFSIVVNSFIKSLDRQRCF